MPEEFDNLTIEEALAEIDAEEAAEDWPEESLEDAETEYAEPDVDDADPNEPGLSGGELVAGEAVSLESVLDTIFNILYTHSAQIQAIGEHLFNDNQKLTPEIPKLTIVGDVE